MARFPVMLPDRDSPLNEAFQQVIDACIAFGLTPEIPAKNSDEGTPFQGLIRNFLTVPTNGTPETTIVVATGPWTRELSLAFANHHLEELSPFDHNTFPKFHFYSAYPLTPMLEYIFRDWAAGPLEGECLLNLQYTPLTFERTTEFATVGCGLLEKYLNISIDLDSTEAIGVLNDLILEHLRPCDDAKLALEPGVYQPVGILAFLGSILGEIIVRAHADKTRWIDPPENIGGPYPILELRLSPDEESSELCYIFPYDKLFQFYQNGQDRDLRTYYNVVIINTLNGVQKSQAEPKVLEDVADLLIPVLKPFGWNAEKVVSIELLPNGPVGSPIVTVALDHPQQIAFVIRSKLDDWNVDLSAVVGRACANLARISRDLSERFEDLELDDIAVFRLGYDDYFNASRIMLAEKLFASASAMFEGAEFFAVAVPNRDHLLLTPARTEEELNAFRHLVLWFHERQPAPISSVCFLLGKEGLVGYYGTKPDA